MLRLVQLENNGTRRIALVEEPCLLLIDGHTSIVSLAHAAIATGVSLSEMVRSLATKESLDYDPIYAGDSQWRLLPSIDHPSDPAHCMVSGTGLTHLGSASDRSAMHAVAAEQMTDSMKMFRWGVDGGKPDNGQIGVAPEWFFKGSGLVLRANGEPLVVPPYAEDGGEEAEVAATYLIGPDGTPFRLGLTIGNEFSDHVFEKKNYLNLAGSKIRTCSIGPELVVAPSFLSVPGQVTIERTGKVFWSKAIATGEAEMVHSLRNIEHHHFKFESHRQPGDVHVHFLGAHSLSFGAGVQLADGDIMTVAFDDFGRGLRNPLRVEKRSESPVCVKVFM
ncbi:MAG: GguC family protein [Planctomycetota bacterium]|nr:GguC family protein [Planctomycetota bacterium]